jgi:hypothetical protein
MAKDFEFRGHKAEVVIELTMRDGSTLRVPVTDLTHYLKGSEWDMDILQIPLRRPLHERLRTATKEAAYGFGLY